MSEELKPCPFEHVEKENGHRPYIQKGQYDLPWIQCTCGASGPLMATEEQAIAAWNTRAPDPLVWQLVEALDEAEAITLDHINLLENQGWTRHQADEIKMANTMLENMQNIIAKAKEAGYGQ